MYGPVFRYFFTLFVPGAVIATVIAAVPDRLAWAVETTENAVKMAKRVSDTSADHGDVNQRISSNNHWNQRRGGEVPHPWRGGSGSDPQRHWQNRDSSHGGRFSQRSQAERGRADFVRWTQQPVSTGYVFIDGKYLPPPYLVRVDDRKLSVNDQLVVLPPSGEIDEERPSDNPAWPWSHRLAKELRMGAVVVAATNSTGQPSITFLPRFDEGYEFLKHISNTTAHEYAATPATAYSVPFAGYEPSPELRDRLEFDLVTIENARVLTSNSVVTDESLGSWAYPLTAVSMLLVAIASGQLFVSRALLVNDANQNASDISKATERCILFIVGLSVLDLMCTLLALQAGVMHELNPLAGQFLGSPWALTAFKIGVTLGSAALLYALRSHFPARRAAWWLCLVCILVTVRWVAFNSVTVM